MISSRSQLALKSSLLFPPCVHLMASLNLSSMTWSQLLLHSTSGQGSSTSTEIKMNPNIYIYIYIIEKNARKFGYRIKKKKGRIIKNIQLAVNVNSFIQMRLLKEYTTIQVQPSLSAKNYSIMFIYIVEYNTNTKKKPLLISVEILLNLRLVPPIKIHLQSMLHVHS